MKSKHHYWPLILVGLLALLALNSKAFCIHDAKRINLRKVEDFSITAYWRGRYVVVCFVNGTRFSVIHPMLPWPTINDHGAGITSAEKKEIRRLVHIYCYRTYLSAIQKDSYGTILMAIDGIGWETHYLLKPDNMSSVEQIVIRYSKSNTNTGLVWKNLENIQFTKQRDNWYIGTMINQQKD